MVFAMLAVVAGCAVFRENKQTTSPTLPAQSLWTGEYGGADKSYDSHLLVLREEIAPRFQQLAFEDRKTGRTIHYNLFIPKNYDPNQQYPLVLFMADASTVGKGVMASLKHGYGGIIWATDESQAKNPSFVLVPSFEGPENVTNDQWQVTNEADVALRLLHHIVGQYSIDKNRLYTTGQSMGGMISFYFNSKYPDLFAASLFVGSQWDVNVLLPLAGKKFFYVVSAADPKASAGMKELGQMLSEKGVTYGETEFSARLPQAEQEAKVGELIRKGYGINFVRFSPNTVTPVNMKMKNGGEHMYSFDYAYQLEAVRDWIFKQKR